MVSSITDSQSRHNLTGTSSQQTTPSGSTDSFTAQLASALEGYLSQSGNNSNLEINIQSTKSQDSGVRQFLVTVKNPDGAAVPTTPAAAGPGAATNSSSPAATTPAASADPPTATFFGFVSTPAVASAAAAGSTSGTDAAPAKPPVSEVDAYWAAQPPEVQQLRDIPDLAARTTMAQKLADQGFTIDKAIMVWGWDPLRTMLTRQAYGYTWAPSWNQGNVSTPGITLAGQTPYDPNGAPSGSIAVNTDFAKGTTISDPWSASQLKVTT